MKTYSIQKDRVKYIPTLDILYIGYEDYSLDFCDEVKSYDRGITVMRTDGKFSGAEIHDFAYYFGDLPARITIDGSNPFVIDIPAI